MKKNFAIITMLILCFTVLSLAGCKGPMGPVLYTVNFNGNGGTPELDTITVSHGNQAAQPDDPVRTDIPFIGWFTADGIEWNFANPITDNLTLYAWWPYTPPLETRGWIQNSVLDLPIQPSPPHPGPGPGNPRIIDALGGLALGTDLILWSKNNPNLSSTSRQIWRFIPDVNEDYYRFQAYSPISTSVFAITLRGDIAEEGMGLILADPDPADDSQWWRLLLQPDGSFCIISKTNSSLGVAVISAIPLGSTYIYNYLTMQPLVAVNNTWIFDPLP